MMSKAKPAAALTANGLRAIIKQALDEAIEASRKQTKKAPDNYYKATERRLYALPDLKDKVAKDKQYLQDLIDHGLQSHSKDIVRFQRTGRRLSSEDILEALIRDTKAKIAADEHEINLIEDALKPLTNDPYFRALEGKYFEQKTDEELGKEIPCDPSTVRRNRGRLVHRVAVRLYGVDAV
ncbi:MAG: hypothetical protein A4E53_02369 [Pelotomaculum sp. PtaB.Bin104]|nr:MAG: hypothetical protein A4E53_02369 [Pelotomaculum sp. PtaB.Bin104]